MTAVVGYGRAAEIVVQVGVHRAGDVGLGVGAPPGGRVAQVKAAVHHHPGGVIQKSG
jgi:hypothetical protein